MNEPSQAVRELLRFCSLCGAKEKAESVIAELEAANGYIRQRDDQLKRALDERDCFKANLSPVQAQLEAVTKELKFWEDYGQEREYIDKKISRKGEHGLPESIDNRMAELRELKAQLEAATKELDKAQKSCAAARQWAMASLNSGYFSSLRFGEIRDILGDCGTGYFKASELEPIIAGLHRGGHTKSAAHDNCFACDVLWQLEALTKST